MYNDIDNSKEYIVYDASIENLQERKATAKTFKSGALCARYIGMKYSCKLPSYTNAEAILQRKRYFSQKHGKEFIIRLK